MQTDTGKVGRRPRVLICDPIADIGVELLRSHAEVDIKLDMSKDELLTIIPGYDAVIVRSATHLTADVIEHGLNLKVIGRASAGLHNINVAVAQKRGIRIVNSPDANTVAVAEHTMGLLLSLARRVPLANFSIKAGKWEKSHFMGTGLKGKTLGIVGFGRIGREVATRAEAFGMKIIVNQKPLTPETLLEDVELVDLMDLLKQSDFVSIHVPLKPETENMIGATELALMKPTAFLVNTVRGGVVDERALLETLNNDGIAGAALDVFVQEPVVNNALVQHERIIATPHIAASTADAQKAAAVMVAQEIIEVFEEIEVETVLPLRVVPMDLVVPHEHIDQKRVDRLAGRLEQDGRLGNPPIVMETEDGRFMVLDGATRTAALKQLGFPHAVVQVTSTDEGLGLRTWYHLIRQIDSEKLFNLLSNLPNVMFEKTDPERVAEQMFEYGAVCYVQFVDGSVYLVYAKHGTNRLDALNALTAAYIEAAHVDRTLNDSIISLRSEYEDMTAVVIFPEYTVNQVVQVTLASGRFFPAGITRFLIPGRILRLNADISELRSDKPLWKKNRWLHNLLLEKQNKGGIRYYAEPVYLLDE
ncbi:MAG: ParB N-terminal domain-containing protein [Chloroflexi bacterium]|nr:ParB N-terminal domain-containing protein [Chloroflexota bacterium]